MCRSEKLRYPSISALSGSTGLTAVSEHEPANVASTMASHTRTPMANTAGLVLNACISGRVYCINRPENPIGRGAARRDAIEPRIPGRNPHENLKIFPRLPNEHPTASGNASAPCGSRHSPKLRSSGNTGEFFGYLLKTGIVKHLHALLAWFPVQGARFRNASSLKQSRHLVGAPSALNLMKYTDSAAIGAQFQVRIIEAIAIAPGCSDVS